MVQLVSQPVSQPTTAATDQRMVQTGHCPNRAWSKLGMVQTGRSWEQFVLVQRGFEQAQGVRLAYYDGTLEILIPGCLHETFSSVMGFLIMTFLVKKGIFLQPTGAAFC